MERRTKDETKDMIKRELGVSWRVMGPSGLRHYSSPTLHLGQREDGDALLCLFAVYESLLISELFTMETSIRISWKGSTSESRATTKISNACVIFTIKGSSIPSENCSRFARRLRNSR